MAKKQALLSVA